jgi:hypothetical protein
VAAAAFFTKGAFFSWLRGHFIRQCSFYIQEHRMQKVLRDCPRIGLRATDLCSRRTQMISGNLDNEPLISLSAAAAWLGGRTGRRPNISTLHRWAIRGCRGVKLETQAVGHMRYTSEAAILRFLNAKPLDPQPVVTVVITPTKSPAVTIADTTVAELRRRVFKTKSRAGGGAA